MTKNILATAALVGALSTGAVAYTQDKDDSERQNIQQQSKQSQFCKHQKNMKNNMQKRKNHTMHKRDGMRMFTQVNLSDKQKYEISILQDEMRLEMKKSRGYTPRNPMIDFITDDGFDKDAFMKDANSRHTKMLQTRADFIDKAFKVLTKEQITKLKTLLSK